MFDGCLEDLDTTHQHYPCLDESPIFDRDDVGKLSERVKEEFLATILPTTFFLIAQSLVVVVRVPMLKRTRIPASTPVQVPFGALEIVCGNGVAPRSSRRCGIARI